MDSTVKEHPLIFSGPMVRANHKGIKRMTRRVVKPMPLFPDAYDALRCEIVGADALFYQPGASLPSHRFHCPYGQPGERIWVRETWRIAAWRDGLCRFACDYQASPEETHTPWIVVENQEWQERVAKIYAELRKINYPSQDGRYQWEHGKAPLRWHPSIHMPRWACRDVYTVTKVRLERLQNISEADAIAEGVEPVGRGAEGEMLYRNYIDDGYAWSAEESFMTLWHTLHGFKGPNAWDRNPWVWVVEYDNPLS